MAQNTTPAASPVVQEDFLAKLAETIAAATTKASIEAQGQYRTLEIQFPPLNNWNNKPGVKRPELRRKTFFCGAEQKPDQLLDEEIRLFNQVKPGRYNNRRWEVIERELGEEQFEIEIRIPTREMSDRMVLPPSLTAILQQIVTEQNA